MASALLLRHTHAVETAAWLVVVTYAGAFVRLALQRAVAAVFPELPRVLFPDFLANVVGCAVMGFLVEQAALPKGTPAYIGLTTGLCGSITTFSAWCAYMALLLGGAAGTPQDLALCLLAGWSFAVVSYDFGRHTAVLLAFLCRKLRKRDDAQEKTPLQPSAAATVFLRSLPTVFALLLFALVRA
eukprot:TRINITY_DN3713_c1_g1_i2.p2 TRINITY_DN3713_c1_g1~~TRINITY_DN3713_c1_g1_i2.p2  ORF type:complete len:185 (+),score=60.04 TRINITY_DN3713_c1_g1_i2:755-1309(+)